MIEQADNGYIFFQTCKFAQITRNKDTSLRVELCIEGVGAVIALDAARLFAVAETADACFERSPLCVGVDKKTAVEALCDREVLAELVAQLGRHGKAPFCVDGMPVFALHPVSPHTRFPAASMECVTLCPTSHHSY